MTYDGLEVICMANRTRADNVDLVPAAEPAGAAYDRDFYSWLMEQARHVREARWDAVDRENLAEEIESLGRNSSTSSQPHCECCWCTS